MCHDHHRAEPNARSASESQEASGVVGQANPLLVDAKEAARLLSISKSTLYSCLSAGMLPKPIRFGRSVRWSLEELRNWVRAGCPPTERWERLKKDTQ